MDKLLPPGMVIVDNNEAGGLRPGLTLRISELDRVRRGDFVTLLLKFPRPATEFTPADPKATEFITCVVAGLRGGITMIVCKVCSNPADTHLHSVTYGDELTVAERYILTHERSTDAQAKEIEPFLTGVIPEPQPVNAEDAKLRNAAHNLPTLAPQRGKKYWLRNGVLVTVWAQHNGVWFGGTDAWQAEWKPDGSHQGGDRNLDIVRDPAAVEVGV